MGILSKVFSGLDRYGFQRRNAGHSEEEKETRYLWETIEKYFKQNIVRSGERKDYGEVEQDLQRIAGEVSNGECGLAGFRMAVDTDPQQLADIFVALLIKKGYTDLRDLDIDFEKNQGRKWLQNPELALEDYRGCLYLFELAERIDEDFNLPEEDSKVIGHLTGACRERIDQLETVVEKHEGWTDEKMKAEFRNISRSIDSEDDTLEDEVEERIEDIRKEVEEKAAAS